MATTKPPAKPAPKKPAPKKADLNKDGTVTPKEQATYDKQQATVDAAKGQGNDQSPKGDKLSMGELESRYEFAYRVVSQNPELMRLWKQATNANTGYWTKDQFKAALRDTNWYQTHAESARKAWTAERLGGEDWDQQLETAKEIVRRRGTELGAHPDDATLSQLARDYLYGGWNDAGRAGLLDDALAKSIKQEGNVLSGAAGNLQQQMRQIAQANGLQFSDSYYQSAAKSVAGGLRTDEDWLRDVRQQAASKWPMWTEKINAGMDMKDLANGYINIMAQTFEIMPDSINLDDPYLKQALTQVDDKGNPVGMGLWDFEQQLKADPRWMTTKQATNKIADIGMDVLRAFGMVK